jgi:hypothetical protein
LFAVLEWSVDCALFSCIRFIGVRYEQQQNQEEDFEDFEDQVQGHIAYQGKPSKLVAYLIPVLLIA